MKKPRVKPDLYINRKGFRSLNVMAVCDDGMTFTYYKTDACGSAHNSRVLRYNNLMEQLESLPAGLCILGRCLVIYLG